MIYPSLMGTRWSTATSLEVAKTYKFLTVTDFQDAFRRRNAAATAKGTSAAHNSFFVLFSKQYPVAANFYISFSGFIFPCWNKEDDMRFTTDSTVMYSFARIANITDKQRSMSNDHRILCSTNQDGKHIDPLKIGLSLSQYQYLMQDQ